MVSDAVPTVPEVRPVAVVVYEPEALAGRVTSSATAPSALAVFTRLWELTTALKLARVAPAAFSPVSVKEMDSPAVNVLFAKLMTTIPPGATSPVTVMLVAGAYPDALAAVGTAITARTASAMAAKDFLNMVVPPADVQ